MTHIMQHTKWDLYNNQYEHNIALTTTECSTYVYIYLMGIIPNVIGGEVYMSNSDIANS